MLYSILLSIVNKEIGKQVHFCHNKDHFCSSFFILTTNFAKNGYFSENKKPLYSHFSGKTKSFTENIVEKSFTGEYSCMGNLREFPLWDARVGGIPTVFGAFNASG